MNAFFKELKERSVYRIAAAYAVAGWLILQLAAIISPALGLPGWTIKAILAVLMAGFTAALWIGWLQDHRALPEGAAPLAKSRRHHFIFAVISVLPALLVAAAFTLAHGTASPVMGMSPLGTVAAIPEKSIAVLPFASFSTDRDNAYFADGIQDEILADLAKVADLKVISRTSVSAYGADSAHRNTHDIGLALGVSHLLEGSVQRDTGKVRVIAQLIDTRSDSHLWAEHYDRELKDIFAIQTEVAERIVMSLKATLSPGEKVVMFTPPTDDMEAYTLYLRANELINGFAQTADWRETLLNAILLLDEATARDRNFALAYCLAARAHTNLYWFNLDHTPARLEQAEAAVGDALRLQPALGEAHLAQALLLYHGSRDFEAAWRELAIAKAALPNNAQASSLASWIERRQGRWPEAVRDEEQAARLDPRNPETLTDLSVLYDILRLYPNEDRVANAAIQALPQSAPYFRLVKAQLQIETGQLAAARRILQTVPPEHDPNGATTFTQIILALYERQFAEAANVLAASKLDDIYGNGVALPRAWLEGLIARAAGQADKAQAAFAAARVTVAATVKDRPDDALAWALLGQIDAGLGQKEDALREGAQALQLRPASADAMDGPGLETSFAQIQAWLGETEPALDRLAVLAKTPSGPHYGELRFDPAWDALRGNARFEKIVAEMMPPPVRE